jgi:hypothetical protein
MNTEQALSPITLASKMLAEASSFEDFRGLRDTAAAARAWAKARGMGIDAENHAFEYVLRAERGMGKTLIEMAESGQRAAPSQWVGRAGVANQHVPADDMLTLPQLGITRNESAKFQRLAREWTDEEFDRRMAAMVQSGVRLSKVNFYRGPNAAARSEAAAAREVREALTSTEPTSLFEVFRDAVRGMIEGMRGLPTDELVQVADMIRALANEYNDVRAER